MRCENNLAGGHVLDNAVIARAFCDAAENQVR
jgi:hypothetical protein